MGYGFDGASNKEIIYGLDGLVKKCHTASKEAGWWNDLHTGERLSMSHEHIASKLMLIVSEIAEALEGHRKDLMDDHLKTRKMFEVELADAVIRIADLSGAMELDLAGAIIDKLDYNTKRPDHKLENRKKANGKKI